MRGTHHVDEVVKEDDLLAAREAASGDGAGALLEGDLLVVAVDRLLDVDLKGALGLAVAAREGLDLLSLVLHKRPVLVLALGAVVHHHLLVAEMGRWGK